MQSQPKKLSAGQIAIFTMLFAAILLEIGVCFTC